MRPCFSLALGIAFGFTVTFLAIGSAVLLATGVGGGILVRERPGYARVLNYDPSDVVLRGVFTGAGALLLLVLFAVVVRKARIRR